MSTSATLRWGALVLVVCLLLGGLPVLAQQVTGTISGSVEDPQKAVIPGAKVVLINQAQGSVIREVTTSAEGTFVLTPVLPGSYTITVEAPGFKTYTKTDIQVYTGDRVGMPPIVLEVGSVGESVTVEASAVSLQTVSAERSGVITAKQVGELGMIGRNFVDLLKTVPGANGQNINGARTDQNNFTVDGVSVNDSGCNCTGMWRVNTDIIEEFKVLTTGQQAEFGRAAGSNIIVVTKAGGREFHGTGYTYIRNESFNANSWSNNYYGRPRSFYRYRTQGFNVGGPVFVPGKFNEQKDKLFFFTNVEIQRPRSPSGLQYRTLPTRAERLGDFSKTHESNSLSNIVTIKDPANNGAAFPGNQIPQDRISPIGKAILNWYDLPNMENSTDPTFNHLFEWEGVSKPNDATARIDYNINPNWKFFFRLVYNKNNQRIASGLSSSNNLYMSPLDWKTGAVSGTGTLTTVITPTLVNEFVYGNSRNYLPVTVPGDSRYLIKNGAPALPLVYNDADPLKMVANLSYGVTNGPTNSFLGLPYDNENPVVNWTDNLTKIFSSHTVKGGIFIELAKKRQTAEARVNGSYDFSRTSQNPYDSNWGFANALLGNFQTFEQASTLRKGYYYYRNFEGYIQDNWKAKSNLSIDYGVRFVYIEPMFEEKNQISTFMWPLYKASDMVRLYERRINPDTGKVASYNPVTGEYGLPTFIGAIVPGVGNMDNGIVQAGTPGFTRGLINSQGVRIEPRFGMAWTPAGPGGKTVVRVGGGMFHERIQGNMVMYQISNPPGNRQPRFYYGNVSNVASLGETYFPFNNLYGMDGNGNIPTIYNFSVTVQRQLPHNILADVAYVGTISRHLLAPNSINNVPFGSAWLPQFQDPTVTPKYDGTTTLAADFARPFLGYSNITYYTYGSSSNYNALQLNVTRRMGKDLTFGVAYTFSKALGVSSSLWGTVHPTDVKKANYGPLSYDVRHMLVTNWIYSIPSPLPEQGAMNNPVTRIAFNGWQLSGIWTLQTGNPTTPSYSIVGESNLNNKITGSATWGPRVVVNGAPQGSGWGDNQYAMMDTSVFAPALKGSQGMDSGQNIIYLPGINNFDISLYKNVRLGANEARYLQFRIETYNTFNHTQWSSFNTAAQFTSSGVLANLPTPPGQAGAGRFGFGATNAARTERRVQLAARIYF